MRIVYIFSLQTVMKIIFVATIFRATNLFDLTTFTFFMV
ncbi:hypothetical protein GMA8713_03547 [Grimontia marina]|uniref:Uncharacterized protein n=1 Tax=Grimontia marina TaxID=646534 RepID=A0A128FG54_9GAMM|nr:hypothetical protein GMA8713_03547 [Grimontia marina]